MTDIAENPRRQLLLQRHGEGVTAGSNILLLSKPDARSSVQHSHSGRRLSQFSHSSFSGFSFLTRDVKDQPQFQNTYRMGPNPGERFQSKKAEEIMKSVLESYLGGEKYNTSICSSLAKQMSDVIKARMKDLGFRSTRFPWLVASHTPSPRYKFVCLVMISQNKHQGMAVASRSVWNPETDNIASASFSNGDLFAVANIYATYFE